MTSNGFLDKDCIGLNEIATYTATTPGEGYVTAEIENVEYIIWFDIIKIRSGLSVDDKSIIYGENIALHFNYNSSATGLVNITLSGKKFNASFMNLNLNETIHLSGSILPDIYDVNVYYEEDGVFVNESARAMLIVSKSEPQIIASDLTVKYGSKIFFIFNLKDSQGNAIMGADTVVVIGDKVYNQKTNKNGEVVLNPVLVPKTYIVTIMFDGNDEYDKTTSIAKVVVKKINT